MLKLVNYLIIFSFCFTAKNCLQNDNTTNFMENLFATTVNPCLDNQFKCQDGHCIDKSKFCDFTFDCADRSDEINCGNCDFETDFCKWETSTTTKVTWKRSNGTIYDHTLYEKQGHVLLLSKTDGGFDDIINLVELSSPKLPVMSTHCELNFYIFKNISTDLSVNISVTSGADNYEYLLPPIKKTNAWTAVQFRIPRTFVTKKNIYIGIMLSTTRFNSGHIIAMDDIEFVNCNPKVLKPQCNFEDGNANDGYCFWMNEGQVNWIRNSGLTSSPKTGPTTDHTTGRGMYLYINQANYSQPNLQAILSSPLITPTNQNGGACFSFWYHMYGEDIGSLYVAIEYADTALSTIEFQVSGSQGDQWKNAQITINTLNDAFIKIIAVTKKGPQGDIAIDDTSFTDGPCVHPALCTFETDMCGYGSSSTGTTQWNRNSGTTDEQDHGRPQYDHTYKNSDGKFMVVAPVNSGEAVSLSSKILKDAGTRCLKFWYSINDDTVGTLKVFQKVPMSSIGGDPLITRSKQVLQTGKLWRRAKVTLKPMQSYQIVFQVKVSFYSFLNLIYHILNL